MADPRESENYVAQHVPGFMPGTAMAPHRNIIGSATYAQHCAWVTCAGRCAA